MLTYSRIYGSPFWKDMVSVKLWKGGDGGPGTHTLTCSLSMTRYASTSARWFLGSGTLNIVVRTMQALSSVCPILNTVRLFSPIVMFSRYIVQTLLW